VIAVICHSIAFDLIDLSLSAWPGTIVPSWRLTTLADLESSQRLVSGTNCWHITSSPSLHTFKCPLKTFFSLC